MESVCRAVPERRLRLPHREIALTQGLEVGTFFGESTAFLTNPVVEGFPQMPNQ